MIPKCSISGSVSSSTTINGWMISVSDPPNHCVEPAMGTGFVFHNTSRPVGFFEGVGTFHDVSVSNFVLLLIVPCVGVVDTVVEFVIRRTLEGMQITKTDWNVCALYSSYGITGENSLKNCFSRWRSYKCSVLSIWLLLVGSLAWKLISRYPLLESPSY